MTHVRTGRVVVSICLVALSVVFLPARLARAARVSNGRRPNVVLIMTDDQGFGDVGVNGNKKIKTPHLDRFATEGVQLTRFYCSPVCAPTRASLMTGRYYYRSGVIHTSRGGAKMHGDELTVAELLSRAGYTTGIFGKWHLGDNYPMRPQDQGFDESLVHRSGGIGQTPDKPNSYFDPVLWRNGKRVKATGYCTDVFFEAALEFIEEHREGPFFVYLSTNAPHTPLEIAPKYSQPYKKQGFNDTTSRVYGMVTNIDDNVGRLLERLEQWKLRDNTIVLFFGDNGPQQQRYTAGLRGRKSWTYEGGIRVPCFVQWPARVAGGRKIDRVAAHVDILPTLLDACQVEPPTSRKFDGVSILPLLSGNAESWPDRALFFQCHRGLTPQRYQNCAVVTQRYKLVGYPGTFGQEDLQTCESPILELYDLTNDEGEQQNVASQHAELASKMRAAYDAWFDDVKSTRGFMPGVIHLGAGEAAARLCRYQDGNFKDGVSHGWTVKVIRGGRYEMTIDRAAVNHHGRLHVVWQGEHLSRPLHADDQAATFELSAGRGVLDIWFQQNGRPRQRPGNNDTLGDVDVRWLD